MAFLARPALPPSHLANCHGDLRSARMRPGRRQGRQGRDGRRGVAVASAVAAALEAWKSVRKHRYTPPSVEAHLRQTGKAVAERGLWNIGMDLLQRARVWKVKVSLDVYKDVLKACERSAQDRAAVKLLELLQDAQTAPDLETYRLVVSSILRARELVRRKSIKSKLDFPVDDVELTEVLEEMWEELPEASPTLQLSALEIIASTGDLPRALQAFEAMEQELHAFYALLVASGQAKQPQATKVILNKAIQRFGHEALLYQKGVLSLWTAGAPKDALKLIEVARQRGIRVDPLMCEAAIYSCVVLNRKPAMLQPWVEEAYATLNEEPKAEAVSAMARALARADDWQTALKLVDYLRDCGARADASVMNAVIHACHRLGQGQKALQVFETMVSNFLTPDALSYHIAILQLVKERSDNAAQLLYREVTRRRLCPAWITGKTSICVTGLNDELAAIATHIFLEEVSKTLVLRNLRITISAESLVDSPHDKAIKKKLTKLISREYGLRPDLLPAGEIWINRLEVKKWKGKMEPRKRKIRKSETALDFSWKAPEELDILDKLNPDFLLMKDQLERLGDTVNQIASQVPALVLGDAAVREECSIFRSDIGKLSDEMVHMGESLRLVLPWVDWLREPGMRNLEERLAALEHLLTEGLNSQGLQGSRFSSFEKELQDQQRCTNELQAVCRKLPEDLESQRRKLLGLEVNLRKYLLSSEELKNWRQDFDSIRVRLKRCEVNQLQEQKNLKICQENCSRYRKACEDIYAKCHQETLQRGDSRNLKEYEDAYAKWRQDAVAWQQEQVRKLQGQK